MSDRVLLSTRKGLFELRRSDTAPGGWRVAASWFIGEPVAAAMIDPRDGTWYSALATGHFGPKFRRSSDGGASWEDLTPPKYPEPTEEELAAEQTRWQPAKWSLEQIWCLTPGSAAQPGRLYAGTIPGGLFISDDRGESWSLVRSLWDRPERIEFWFGGGFDAAGIHSVIVDPRDDQRIICGVSCGGVWESADGGATWSQRAHGMIARYMPPERQEHPDAQDPHLVVQSPSHPDVFWCQHHNGIFRCDNNLARWAECEGVEPCSYGFAVAVHPSDPASAWFVPMESDGCRTAPGGKLVVTHTADGGRTFVELRRGLPQEHAYDLTFRHALDVAADGRTLLFGTTSGSVFSSFDGGESWSTVSNHLPPVYALSFA